MNTEAIMRLDSFYSDLSRKDGANLIATQDRRFIRQKVIPNDLSVSAEMTGIVGFATFSILNT